MKKLLFLLISLVLLSCSKDDSSRDYSFISEILGTYDVNINYKNWYEDVSHNNVVTTATIERLDENKVMIRLKNHSEWIMPIDFSKGELNVTNTEVNFYIRTKDDGNTTYDQSLNFVRQTRQFWFSFSNEISAYLQISSK